MPQTPLPASEREGVSFGYSADMSLVGNQKYKSLLVVWLCACTAWAVQPPPSPSPVSKPVLTLGTSSAKHAFIGAYLRNIYRELARRTGIGIDITTLPLARLSLEVANDKLDGDSARALAFGQAQPQLLRLEEPVMEVQLALWATEPRVKLARLEDLGASGYTVTYPRGMLICENALKPLLPPERLTDINSTVQGVEMLHYARSALLCAIDADVLSESQEFLPNKPLPLRVLNIGKPMPLYLYLQPRHSALVAPLQQALKRMRQDGAYERLRRETLEEIQRPTTP